MRILFFCLILVSCSPKIHKEQIDNPELKKELDEQERKKVQRSVLKGIIVWELVLFLVILK